MALCGVCGRMVEVSESGQAMPCVPECLNYQGRPWDSFLAYAAATTVGLPSLEVVNGRLVDYEDDEEYERDRKLCMDQDSDKDYRKGHNR